MKRSLSSWQTIGFIFTSIAGVILHFLFDWTGESAFVAWFSAVNESVWEHMKLLFVPLFLFALAERRYIGKEYESFWCVKLFGIVLGVVLIPILYYTIRGIFGTIPEWVSITTYFVAAAISFAVETRLLKNNILSCKSSKIALLILWIIAIIFVILTFISPEIPLFEDPITGTYGI